MESRFLTVAEAARYLRLNPRSVYLLAQRGAIPASRATGKWLFPVRLLDEWLERSARERAGIGGRPRGLARPVTLLLAGSDDPALELLPDTLGPRPAGPLLFTATLGSTGGLAALGQGRADVACAHLLDRASGEYNLPHVRQHLADRPAVVVTCFRRELGLVAWTGNPRKLTEVADLARPGVRFVNRQPGSGTRAFLDGALGEAGLTPAQVAGYADAVSTHWAVGLRVLRAEADAGLATRAVATALSLAFVPLARERFDLIVPRDAFFEPAVQALIEAVRSARFQRGLERLGGYDWREAGRVLAEVA
jgi:putative molybdopterin biosynthesis protein